MVTSNTEIEQILSPETNFITDIEKCVESGCDIFDCMLEWSSKRNIEFEQIVPIIRTNQLFKAKVTEAAEKLHFLKKMPPPTPKETEKYRETFEERKEKRTKKILKRKSVKK